MQLFGLDFRAIDGIPVEKTLVLDEEYLTFDLAMLGFAEDPNLAVTYSSCDYSLLPEWDVDAELEDGTSIHLRERFLSAKDLTRTGPAAVEFADVSIGGERQVVGNYWDLVYSSGRHNVAVTYWVLLDPPVSVPGVEGMVHALEFDAEDPPEVFELVAVPQEAAVRYLDESFEVLAEPAVLTYNKEEATEPRFLRGDAFEDGTVDISDAVRILDFLFRGGAPPSCEKAADADDDGRLAISDPVAILLHLFRERTLPTPADTCETDPTVDALTCESFSGCP